METALFFDFELVQGSPPEEVKRACKDCAVRESCLEEALRFEPFGYRGGTTPGQRRSMRKRRHIRLVPVEELLGFHRETNGLVAEIHYEAPRQLALF
jgi:hypothetical protein